MVLYRFRLIALQYHIGRDAFVHVGEEFAGSSQAGLNFVRHQ